MYFATVRDFIFIVNIVVNNNFNGEYNFMTHNAVIFDLDGTLINSLEDLADSTNEVLTKYGFTNHSIEAYKKFIGNGMRQLVKNSVPKNTEESLIDTILQDLKSIYNKNFTNKTHPYENVHSMLEKLKELGIKMAVCSNKPDSLTNEIVEEIIGKDYFGVIFGEREGIPRKPDPTSLLEASRHLEVEPEKIIYLGDSGGDMICANKAGMFAIGALWGFREEKELVEGGAQILLSEPMELLEYIKKHR
jgi:phosphoglycolate phosphatase